MGTRDDNLAELTVGRADAQSADWQNLGQAGGARTGHYFSSDRVKSIGRARTWAWEFLPAIAPRGRALVSKHCPTWICQPGPSVATGQDPLKRSVFSALSFKR